MRSSVWYDNGYIQFQASVLAQASMLIIVATIVTNPTTMYGAAVVSKAAEVPPFEPEVEEEPDAPEPLPELDPEAEAEPLTAVSV